MFCRSFFQFKKGERTICGKTLKPVAFPEAPRLAGLREPAAVAPELLHGGRGATRRGGGPHGWGPTQPIASPTGFQFVEVPFRNRRLTDGRFFFWVWNKGCNEDPKRGLRPSGFVRTSGYPKSSSPTKSFPIIATQTPLVFCPSYSRLFDMCLIQTNAASLTGRVRCGYRYTVALGTPLLISLRTVRK